MAGATIIGEVAVKVRPDTGGFRGQTKRQLDVIEKGLSIDVDVEADTSGLVSEVESAAEAAEKALKKIRLNLDLDDADELSRGIKRVNAELDELRERSVIKFEANESSLRAVRARLEAMRQLHVQAEIDIDNQAFRALRRRVEDAMKGVEFSPTLAPVDRIRLERDLRQAYERLDGLRANLELAVSEREKYRLKREIEGIEAEIEVKLGEAGVRVTQARLAWLAHTRFADIVPRVNRAAAAKAGATLAALSGGRAVSNTLGDIADWIGGLDKAIPRIAAVNLGVLNLGSSLMAATSNVLSFGQGLASIGPGILALPGIAGGLALGLGASYAVLKDFNEILPEVGKRFTALQDSMSDRFWSVAKNPVQGFFDTLMPEFESGMNRVSTSLGGWFGDIADSMGTILKGPMQLMFDDLSESIRVSAEYTDQFAGIIQKLGSLGAGYLPQLAGWVGDIATKFDDWLGRKGEQGLRDMVDTAVESLQDLGQGLRHTGRFFREIADAANSAGGNGLKRFAENMKTAADVAGREPFKSELTQTFLAAHEAMERISSTSGPAFQSFVKRLADTFQTIAPLAGTALGDLVSGVFEGLDQVRVSDSVIGFFDQLADSAKVLRGVMPEVGQGLAGVVDVITKISGPTIEALARILGDLGPAFDKASKTLDPFIDALGDLVLALADVGGPAVAEALDMLASLATSFTPVVKAIEAVVRVIGLLPEKLIAVAALAAAGTWLGAAVRTKVALMGASLVTMGEKATIGATGLTAAGTAAQGFATRMSGLRLGVAGGLTALGAVTSAASDGNRALGILGGALSGAGMGSLAGPWGAAIGGITGALTGLFIPSTNDAAEAQDRLKVSMQGVIETLNAQTGAFTKDTRKNIVDKLIDLDGLERAKQYGFDLKELVDVVMSGSTKDLALMFEGSGKGAQDLSKDLKVLMEDMQGIKGDADLAAEAMGESGLQRQIRQVADEIEKGLRPGGMPLLEGMTAYVGIVVDENGMKKVFQAQAALDGVPDEVVTHMQTKGVEASLEGMRKLTARFEMTPSEVKTLVSALGVDLTDRQLKKLIERAKEVGQQKPKVKVEADAQPVKDLDKAVKEVGKSKGEPEVKVKDSATKPLKKIEEHVKRLVTTDAHVTIRVIDQATARIAIIQAQLGLLRDKTVNVTTYHRQVNSNGDGKGKSSNGSKTSSRMIVDDAVTTATRAMSTALPEITAVATTAGKAVANTFLDSVSGADDAAVATAAKKISQTTANVYKSALKSFSSVEARMKKIQSNMGKIQKKASKATVKALKDEMKSLKGLMAEYNKRVKQIKDEQAALANLRAEKAAYKEQVANQISLTGDPTRDGANSLQAVLGVLRLARDEAVKFQAVIAELIAGGLNENTLQMLISAGPEAALGAAQAILGGGKDAIKEVNGLQKQIDNAATEISKSAGNYVFDTQIKQAEKSIKSLAKALDPLATAMEKATKLMLSKMNSALKKKIPEMNKELRSLAKEIDKVLSKQNQLNNGSSKKNTLSAGGGGIAGTNVVQAKATSFSSSNAATAGKSIVYNYYAADGPSLSSEEALFDSLSRSRALVK